MKLFEYADNVTLPDGKVLSMNDANSFPFMYMNDNYFFLGVDGGTHIGSIEDYFNKLGNEEYREARYSGNPDDLDDFLYEVLGNATFTGRAWINDKVMSFWDLNNGAGDRKRMKDIVKNLEEELNIKIDPKEWWLEFSDTQGIPYFVILNDFIENNDLKYGIIDEDDKLPVEVVKAWHLLNSQEKLRLKKEYGMDKYKPKRKPLAWKQALLKSESLRDKMTPVPEEEIRRKVKDELGVDDDVISVKIYNPHGYKLVGGNGSTLKEENYRVHHHKLTGDVVKIYNFLIDYYNINPGDSLPQSMKELIIKDDTPLTYTRKRNSNFVQSNESLRNKMKPKSKEEIIKSISSPESKLTPTEKFMEASRYGILSIVKKIMIDDDKDILKYNDYIPFYLALAHGHIDIVKFMSDYIDDEEIIKFGIYISKKNNQIDIFNYLNTLKINENKIITLFEDYVQYFNVNNHRYFFEVRDPKDNRGYSVGWGVGNIQDDNISKFNRTDRYEQFKVFKEVKEIFINWFNETKPEKFYFSVPGRKRMELYINFINKITNNDFDYKIVETDYDSFDLKETEVLYVLFTKKINESLRNKMIPKSDKELKDVFNDKIENIDNMTYAEIRELWLMADEQIRKQIEDKFNSKELKAFQAILRSHHLEDYKGSELAKKDEWMEEL